MVVLVLADKLGCSQGHDSRDSSAQLVPLPMRSASCSQERIDVPSHPKAAAQFNTITNQE